MHKNWKLISGIGLLICTLLLALFFYFTPKKTDPTLTSMFKSTVIAYADLETHLKEVPGIHYLYFCDVDNADCAYIDTDILIKLAADANVAAFADIEAVDVSKIPSTITPQAIKKIWGFSTIPAFVSLEYKDSAIIVHSALEWDAKNPFTMDQIKAWMKNNGIWRAEYTN